MCEFHESTCNGFGDIWWTDNPIYFSSIDVVYNLFLYECKPVYALEMNCLGYIVYIFKTFYYSIACVCVVSRSPE